VKDVDYMKFALDIANKVSAQTSPNPTVGAVVVQNGEIVGFGAHLKAGEAHAEVNALEMAGEKAKDATIYITLEPCNHYGKTSPCADLIIEKGIKRAVVAMIDPNVKVNGGGMERLRQSGIDVELGLLEKEATALNAAFFHYTKTNRPFVTVKSAVSIDGKTATATGDSKWITSEAARLDVHHYRHTHDAILVGVGTVLADNPNLTARLPDGGRNPLRVILDTKLRTPIDANVISDNEAETWLFVGKQVTEQEQAPYIAHELVSVIQIDAEQLSVDEILLILGRKGIASLFVEGGATVNGAFLEAKQINQFIFYMAPMLIGGTGAPTSFTGAGFQTITETLALDIETVERIGGDIKLVAVPRKEDANVYRNN
jgi:diaminohydroxyphosphoribosylaminopyrimidine deaminase/5-amino-6-(5-phosphoribosylamino)uracil reductase